MPANRILDWKKFHKENGHPGDHNNCALCQEAAGFAFSGEDMGQAERGRLFYRVKDKRGKFRAIKDEHTQEFVPGRK